MRNRRVLAGCICLAAWLQFSCAAHQPALTDRLRKEIVAHLIDLDDQRNAAADRGDADAALGFISRSPEFRYVLNGRMLEGFAEFEAVVRESYAARKTATSEVKDREIIVLSPDVALNVNRCQHEVILRDDTKINLLVLYGSVWLREAGGWRVIHEYENVVP